MIDFRTYFDSHTHALPLALPLFLLFSMLQFSVYSLVSWSVNGSFFVHSFEKSHLIVNTGVFLIVFKTHLALLFTVSIKIYSKVQFFFAFAYFVLRTRWLVSLRDSMEQIPGNLNLNYCFAVFLMLPFCSKWFLFQSYLNINTFTRTHDSVTIGDFSGMKSFFISLVLAYVRGKSSGCDVISIY